MPGDTLRSPAITNVTSHRLFLSLSLPPFNQFPIPRLLPLLHLDAHHRHHGTVPKEGGIISRGATDPHARFQAKANEAEAHAYKYIRIDSQIDIRI